MQCPICFNNPNVLHKVKVYSLDGRTYTEMYVCGECAEGYEGVI